MIYFTLFFLLIACAEKRGTLGLAKIPNYNAEEYFYAEECRKKGNLEQALLFYQLSIGNTFSNDSIPYWWKAKLGRGDIYMELHRFQDAKEDFKDMLEFARRHCIDSALYFAHRNLSVINRREGNCKDAFAHILQAQRAVQTAGIQGDMKKEILLASAACAVQNHVLMDSVVWQLQKLANDSCAEWRANALQVLTLHADRNCHNEYLEDFLQAQKVYHESEIHDYMAHLEHEKAVLRQELNEKAQRQQSILFVSLIVFALIISGCVYATLRYRQKHETDRIRLILKQKEDFIRFMEEEKKCNVSQLQERIVEKERQMKRLEYENKRMADDICQLSGQIQEKEDEQKKQEERFSLFRFFDTEIGKDIPAPENPYHPQRANFEKLLAKDERRMHFIAICNICFGGFAEGLRYLTPTLTNDDLMYCCLFKLNVRTKDIALMVCQSCSTVSTRRKRIEMKMEKGSVSVSGEKFDT